MKDRNRYEAKAQERLAHIQKHLKAASASNHGFVRNIVDRTGSPSACAMLLANHATAMAMNAWFADQDLSRLRQWMHIKAGLDKFRLAMLSDTAGPGAKMLQLLAPLVSNDRALIRWFAECDTQFDMARVDDSKTHDFWAYQSIVAIRGDWTRLTNRCEAVFAAPPKTATEQKYLGDHRFFFALAKGQVDEMRTAIENLLTPAALSSRSKDESGYTDGLISTPAVIYLKIARLHGFEVSVDSPYVPPEWLPMQPLDQYDDIYPFLRS
jgi:hypothetical protein